MKIIVFWGLYWLPLFAETTGFQPNCHEGQFLKPWDLEKDEK